jgi:hypothetical protein
MAFSKEWALTHMETTTLAFTIQEIDEIPARRGARGARDSKCLEIVRMTAATSKKRVAVTSDSEDEFAKFYKSLIQWVRRHLDERVNVRKDGRTLYLWISAPGEAYVFGRQRKPRQPAV